MSIRTQEKLTNEFFLSQIRVSKISLELIISSLTKREIISHKKKVPPKGENIRKENNLLASNKEQKKKDLREGLSKKRAFPKSKRDARVFG